MTNTANIIDVISAIICVVMILFQITGLVMYIPYYRTEVCCQNRHSPILNVGLILSNICFLFWDIIDIPYILTFIRMILFNTSILFMALFFTKHLWIHYFNGQYTYYIYRNKWEMLLNNKNNLETVWFIKYKDTFGNKAYIDKIYFRLAIFYGIVIISHSIITYLTGSRMIEDIIGMIYAASLGIPLVILAVLYSKEKKVNDVFMINSQIKSMLGMAILLIIAALGTTFGFTKTGANLFIYIRFYAWVILTSLITCIDTFGVKYFVINVFGNNAIENGTNVPVPLDGLLQRKSSIDHFMEHLTQEYNVELLTSIIEFMQYELYSKSVLNVQNDDNNHYKLTFPSHIPTSHIITLHSDNKDMNNIQKCKHIAYDLYHKYIQRGSTYEINISYYYRDKLISMLDNKEIWLRATITNDELCDMFHKCIIEMRTLLGYALSRMRVGNTDLYAKIEHSVSFPESP